MLEPGVEKLICDDPSLDGTDCAHPAFWRGVDYGIAGLIIRIERILAKKDNGSGVIGNPKIEALRRKLLLLVGKD